MAVRESPLRITNVTDGVAGNNKHRAPRDSEESLEIGTAAYDHLNDQWRVSQLIPDDSEGLSKFLREVTRKMDIPFGNWIGR